jgi:acetate kinase
MRILCIDRGSSSLKCAVFEIDASCETRILDGAGEPPAATASVAALFALVRERGVEVDAVGHRLVYGGSTHEAPARVTPDLLTSLTALVPFDPLHMPAALATIREIETARPGLPQVACFDTAFHRDMPAVAQRLPVPRELWSEGVRRYGFHGLSYESIVHALGPAGVRGRMIVAHLGNGASLAAMRDGRPVDTTMGLTPLGGIMMGTRPGDLDPGVLLYLLRERGCTPAELGELITRRSGLLGVSQISADMRTLLERRAAATAAAEAVELFVYLAKKSIGALAAVLGGLDTLVFTGGIGEHAAPVRAEIASGLAYLGVALDATRNDAHDAIVSAAGAAVAVRVIAANENLMVARHTWRTLFA